MRKQLLGLFGILALSAGVAFAQTDVEVETPDVEVDPGSVVVELAPEEGVDFDTSQYLGIGFGIPGGLHYGLEDVAFLGEGADLRFRLVNYLVLSFGVGADVLFDITQIEDNIQLYGGGGVEFSTSVLGAFNGGVHGIVGGEYRFNEEIGIFSELGPGLGFQFPYLSFRFTLVGLNYHF